MSIVISSLCNGLFTWGDLSKNSPASETRNSWLYEYGAFCYDKSQHGGIWYPCTMQSYTLNGNWYKVNPVSDMVLPPKIVLKPGTSAEDVILYRVFRDGRPLKNKLLEYENLLDQTSKYIEILSAKAAQPDLWIGPKSLISDIKKAVINARFSSEPYMVANSQVLAENPIQTVQTPDPSKQLEALWTRYDYIVQEICAVLGLPYNPNQNKKERLNKHEVISEHSRIMPVINSMESMLKPSAKEMGETVEHISSKLIRDSGIERV